ncbi:histidine kinase [Nocardioidaceae bacterium SCSIO 66511]|nr:histidine kinase [Nocardioidaceae bacterium SCSIO 66511]
MIRVAGIVAAALTKGTIVAERRRLRLGRDVGIAVAITAVALGTLPYLDHTSAGSDADIGGVILVVIAGLALVVRTWWPVGVLIVSGGAAAAYLVLGYAYGFVLACVAVAVYTVATRVPIHRAIGWSAVMLVALLAHLRTNPAALDGAAGIAPATAWVIVPLTIGASRRLVLGAQARERAIADRRLVDTERLRLSQEVHDVVGHGLAAIQMQSDIALHLASQKPDQALTALKAISHASSDALTELRATLGAIGANEAGARTPSAGLANLPALRERVEAAGVSVDLTVSGTPRPLPWGVDLAAYRVLQEALTNVVKHSADPRAVVRVDYRDSGVDLVVTNRPPEVATTGAGLGIDGMKRRVDQLGGTLTVGPPVADSTAQLFELRASLPTPAKEDE